MNSDNSMDYVKRLRELAEMQASSWTGPHRGAVSAALATLVNAFEKQEAERND